MTAQQPRRGGFSLIEILVVMAIIGVLSALAVGTFFRIAAGQRVKTAEGALRNLQTAFDNRRKAIVEEVADPRIQPPQAVVTFTQKADPQTGAAVNDLDRARTVWAYLRLKNEFPTTYTEAVTDIFIDSNGNNVADPGEPALKHRKLFEQVLNTGSNEEQSAACLYLALTATGSSGVAVGGDTFQRISGDGPAGRSFLDVWNKPIAFSRLTYSAELDAQPYQPATASATSGKDSLDAKGRLSAYDTVWTQAKRDAFWSAVVANHLASGGVLATYDQTRNWMMTAVSGGPNLTLTGPPGLLISNDDAAGDNLISYRLRKEGRSGN